MHSCVHAHLCTLVPIHSKTRTVMRGAKTGLLWTLTSCFAELNGRFDCMYAREGAHQTPRVYGPASAISSAHLRSPKPPVSVPSSAHLRSPAPITNARVCPPAPPAPGPLAHLRSHGGMYKSSKWGLVKWLGEYLETCGRIEVKLYKKSVRYCPLLWNPT